MFYEDDEVQLTNLHPNLKEMLEDVMEVDFEEIDFYFVEYEDGDNIVLSAETDVKHAIVCVPVEALDGYVDYEEEVEQLLNHVIGTHIVNRALDEKNKELFDACTEHLQKPRPAKEKGPHIVSVNMLYDMETEELSEDEWREYWDVRDEE